MIVPMKKAYIIVQKKDSKEAVASLRSLGLIHIEHQTPPEGTDVVSIKDDIATLDRVDTILTSPGLCGRSGLRDLSLITDWRFAAKHIIDTYARIDHLVEYSHTLTTEIAAWVPWGDFDPASITALHKRGVQVRLFRIPAKDSARLPKDLHVRRVAVQRGLAYCAAVSRGSSELPASEIMPPRLGLNEMRMRLTENDDIIRALKDTIRKFTCYHDRFLHIRQAFARELEFHEAMHGMGRDGGLAYLAGYIPVDVETVLRDAAKRNQWGLVVTEPSEDDAVPTLVRNPRWVELIAPVFRMLEIVPGYHELDISFWFLAFFSVFFGMLIGDAGTGLIFLILTVIGQVKFGKRVKEKGIFFLFYLLSGCAIVWGLLSGTFFGQEWLPHWFKPLVPALRDDKKVQELCFLLGATQLSIAHLWRAVIKAPSPRALGDIGWVLFLWGGYFLAKMLVLGEPFPAVGGWLFIAGTVLILCMTKPSKNVLKGLGAGAGALLLNGINSFTDIVSYIRLFAVGLAAVAISDAFNQMALEIGFGNFVSGLIAALILVIGQVLNVLLGPLSVVVHGVRLNVLEFCSHLDIKWSGFRYRPLKD